MQYELERGTHRKKNCNLLESKFNVSHTIKILLLAI